MKIKEFLLNNIIFRANHLLAFLALCDILVFIMMLPHFLSSIDTLAASVSFRSFLFDTKVHFAALTNWFSAAAIWYFPRRNCSSSNCRFVFAISLERLLVIKNPFRSLDDYNVGVNITQFNQKNLGKANISYCCRNLPWHLYTDQVFFKVSRITNFLVTIMYHTLVSTISFVPANKSLECATQTWWILLGRSPTQLPRSRRSGLLSLFTQTPFLLFSSPSALLLY